MENTIITTYYLCDEFLKAIGHRDDPQVRLSTAEVMAIPLVACAFFSGNLEASRSFLDEYGSRARRARTPQRRRNRRTHPALTPREALNVYAAEQGRAVQQIRREAEGLVREYLDVTGRSELYDLVARRRS